MKEHKPPSPVDWSAMTPNEIAAALRAIPRCVAYAWHLTADGDWVREDAEEYGVARAAMVTKNDDGTWRGPPVLTTERRPGGSESRDTRPSASYKTAEEAKYDYDRYLLDSGWLIDDTDDGSGEGPPLDDRKEIIVGLECQKDSIMKNYVLRKGWRWVCNWCGHRNQLGQKKKRASNAATSGGSGEKSRPPNGPQGVRDRARPPALERFQQATR